MADEPVADQEKNAPKTWWIKIFVWGLLLYLGGLVALFVTVNPNLFPTVALIGNLLVPVTYVAFFYERGQLCHLNLPVTGFAFLYGGIVGVVASALLEPLFVKQSLLVAYAAIGVIEESSKMLGVMGFSRHMKHNVVMDGLVLGAAVGMGFAALESMGYTFGALINNGGSLTATVSVTLVRGLFTPIGHGTWTAILASVLFQQSTETRFRITPKVVFAFFGVILLHSLWDGLPSFLSASLAPFLNIAIGEAIVGGLGLLVLWLRFRAALRQEAEEQAGETGKPDLQAELALPIAVTAPSKAGPDDITQKLWIRR